MITWWLHRYLLLFKSLYYATSLLGKTHRLVPVFSTQKKSEDIFTFTKKKKRWKAKTKLTVFQPDVTEAARIQSSGSGTTKLLPWELHSASQHQDTIALNCVCELLCFNSAYFVPPLIRYAQGYQKSLKELLRVLYLV